MCALLLKSSFARRWRLSGVVRRPARARGRRRLPPDSFCPVYRRRCGAGRRRVRPGACRPGRRRSSRPAPEGHGGCGGRAASARSRRPCRSEAPSGPVVEPGAVGAFAGRQRRPLIVVEVVGQGGRVGLNKGPLFEEPPRVVRPHGKSIGLAPALKHAPQLGLRAVERIGQPPCTRNAGVQGHHRQHRLADRPQQCVAIPRRPDPTATGRRNAAASGAPQPSGPASAVLPSARPTCDHPATAEPCSSTEKLLNRSRSLWPRHRDRPSTSAEKRASLPSSLHWRSITHP